MIEPTLQDAIEESENLEVPDVPSAAEAGRSADVPSSRGEPSVWRAAEHELFAVEADVIMRWFRASGYEVEENKMLWLAACAVMLARRTDKSIPLERCTSLTLGQLDIIPAPNFDDPGDPTPAA